MMVDKTGECVGFDRRLEDIKDRYGNEVSKLEKISHNWEMLNDWYSSFLPSTRGINWINWFDTNFPLYAHISNIKKIDFIIFSCSGY